MTVKKIEREQGPGKAKLDDKGTDWFVGEILAGRTMTSIAAEVGVHLSVVIRWIAQDKDRERQIAIARQASARIFDELAEVLIAKAKNSFQLQKARELGSHYRWRARVMDPKTYGEKLEIDATNRIVDLTDDKLQARLAELLAKRDGINAPPSTDGAG